MADTPFPTDDISSLPQPDVAAGPAPGGDQSQLLLNLLRQSGGRTVGMESALPAQNDPSADLRAYLQKISQESPHDALLKKLHMTREEMDNRGKWGNIGQKAGNLAQAVLFGRNFRNEANQDYAAQTQRINQGNDVIRNEDIAKQAKATLDVNAAYKQGTLDIRQQQADETARKNEATETLKQQGVNIAKMAAEGKLSRYDVQNWLDSVKGKNLQDTEGLSGMYGWSQKFVNSSPEEQAKMARALATGESTKLFGKLITTGSDSSSSQSIGPDGNIVTTRGTNKHFGGAGGNILQQMLGLPPQNPLAQFGTPGFAGGKGAADVAAPQRSTNPVINRLQNSIPPAAPPPLADINDVPMGKPMDPQTFLKNHAGEVGGNIAMMKSLQDNDKKTFETAQKLYTAKMLAVEDTAKQRANLANGMINGSSQNYQGFIPALLEKARNIVGDVGANEALGRPLDYDALYGKLGASVKGTFKNVEINSATGTLGKRDFNAQNALFLHAANELSQRAQAAAVGKQLEDKNGRKLVGPEELTQAMADEITRYMNAVKKAKDANGPIAKLTGTAPQAPVLKSIEEVVNDYRMKKKIGLAPKASAPTDARTKARQELM